MPEKQVSPGIHFSKLPKTFGADKHFFQLLFFSQLQTNPICSHRLNYENLRACP